MAADARYHRQMLLPGFGEAGQRRVASSHALVVGCGALGTTICDLLARAGVGRLTIVDRDVVELTNLQRQTLYTEADAAEGAPKAEAARRRLAGVNADVRVRGVVADFTHVNAERLAGVAGGSGDPASLGPADVLLDGTDNIETRFLLNDLAVKHGLPFVYAGAVGFESMTMTVLPRGGAGADEPAWAPGGPTPCLRCVFPEAPAPGATPTCDTAGVLGPVASMIASVQAVEALKVLLGRFDLISRSLLRADPWRLERQRIDVAPLLDAAGCPCCAGRRFEYLSGERAGPAATLCGRNAVQIAAPSGGGVDLEALAARLVRHGAFTRTPFLVRGVLRDERAPDAASPIELTVFADGRAIVGGADRPETARSIYAKYVGA